MGKEHQRGASEIAQWSRVLAPLSKEPGSVPRNYMVVYELPITPVLGDLKPLKISH